MPEPVRHYDVGDEAVVDATFSDEGVATDPGTVTGKVRNPQTGAITTYVYGVDAQLGRSTVGVYFMRWPITVSGYWRYRIEGTAPAPGAAAGILVGDPNPFDALYAEVSGRALCTLEEVKEYVGEDPADPTYDLLMRRMIDDCAQAMYRYSRREFTPIVVAGVGPFERSFDVGLWEREERRIAVGDLASTVGLVVRTNLQDGTAVETVAAGSVVGLPRRRDSWEPITELWFPSDVAAPSQLASNSVVTVAGDWGFPAVPGDVRQLAIVQVGIWYARDIAKFAGTFNLTDGRIHRPRLLDDAVRDGLTEYKQAGAF